MADEGTPEFEALVEGRLIEFRRVAREHEERSPASGLSFCIKPDDAVGREAYLRMSGDGIEQTLQEATGQQPSPEEAEELRKQVREMFQRFLERGKAPEEAR